MKNRYNQEQEPRFSIRKLTIGVVSVMFAMALWTKAETQNVRADTNAAGDQQTEQVEKKEDDQQTPLAGAKDENESKAETEQVSDKQTDKSTQKTDPLAKAAKQEKDQPQKEDEKSSSLSSAVDKSKNTTGDKGTEEKDSSSASPVKDQQNKQIGDQTKETADSSQKDSALNKKDINDDPDSQIFFIPKKQKKDPNLAKELLESKFREDTVNLADWDYTSDALHNTVDITDYHGNEINIVIPNNIDFIRAGKLNPNGKVYLKFKTAVTLRNLTNVDSLRVSSNGGGKVYLDREGARDYYPYWNTNWAWAFTDNHFKTMDLSHLDTSNATRTDGMFRYANNLTSINLTGWDMSHVTTIAQMFGFDYNLRTIEGLSGWDVSHVQNMAMVFEDCQALTTPGDLSNWQTGHANKMMWMFYEDYLLQNIGDLSRWDTSKVTDMSGMFNGCHYLENIGDLSHWQTGKVTNMRQMFEGCETITDLGDLSHWDVSHVTNTYSMFFTTAISHLNLSHWNLSRDTDASWMFGDEISPIIIDLSQATLPAYHFTVRDFYGYDQSDANWPIIVLNHDLEYLNSETKPGENFVARQNSNYLDIYNNGSKIAKIPMDFVFDNEAAVGQAFARATTLDSIRAHLLAGQTLPDNITSSSLTLHKLLKDWEDGKTDWNQLFYQIAGSYDLHLTTRPDQPTAPTNPTTPTAPTSPANPTSPVEPSQPTNAPTQPSNVQPTQATNVAPLPERSGSSRRNNQSSNVRPQAARPPKAGKTKGRTRQHTVRPQAQHTVRPQAQAIRKRRSKQGKGPEALSAKAASRSSIKTLSNRQNGGKNALPQTGNKTDKWAFLGLTTAALVALLGMTDLKKRKSR